ncbi:hypothetical protein PFISCL1PPCAC_18176, partial [Pristionchus fissidentatus]
SMAPSMTKVSLAPVLGTIPSMMILLLMTLTLVSSLLVACNTKKKKAMAEIAKREKEKEDAKKKKEKEEREEEDKIYDIVDARIRAENEAKMKKWEDEKTKIISELMKKGDTEFEAERRVYEIGVSS